MTFLLRPQIILLSVLIATPCYAAYECRRLTKLYPRRKPEHFSLVLIPPRPCTQHVPRSNAVVFSARLHGDVLYAARRRYFREHAGEMWDDAGGAGVEEVGGKKKKRKPRSAFDDGGEEVSLNELWARTWLGGSSISREARWFGVYLDWRKKPTASEEDKGTKTWSASGSVSTSISIDIPSDSPFKVSTSSTGHTSSPPPTPGSTPDTSNTIPFAPNQPILRGLQTVVRPPTENDGLLMQWDVPHAALVHWAKIERFMGMWMPWRIFSGGKQLLDVVPVWENGALWVDVRYACAQFYEDDMSEDPLPADSPDRQQRHASASTTKKPNGGKGGGMLERIRHPGVSISGVDKRKELPLWSTWCHEMYARKLLDDAVRKLVRDAKTDLGGDGDGASRKRAMRVQGAVGVGGTRIVEDEGSIMRAPEAGR